MSARVLICGLNWIGDSLMARRIIDGVREGRNVLDTLEDMGALGNRESTKIPFLTY